MKYYTLQAIINGENKTFSEKFTSRQNAIDFMFDYLERAYIFDKQVEEEYTVGNDKHKVEYVCDYSTRFIINRTIA